MSPSPQTALCASVSAAQSARARPRLMEALCKRFAGIYDLCAITNDIYTKEDARNLLTVAGGAAGGAYSRGRDRRLPAYAIREDCSLNLSAIETMRRKFP